MELYAWDSYYLFVGGRRITATSIGKDKHNLVADGKGRDVQFQLAQREAHGVFIQNDVAKTKLKPTADGASPRYNVHFLAHNNSENLGMINFDKRSGGVFRLQPPIEEVESLTLVVDNGQMYLVASGNHWMYTTPSGELRATTQPLENPLWPSAFKTTLSFTQTLPILPNLVRPPLVKARAPMDYIKANPMIVGGVAALIIALIVLIVMAVLFV